MKQIFLPLALVLAQLALAAPLASQASAAPAPTQTAPSAQPAEALFNSRLTADERAALGRGEALVRNIGTVRHVCVNDTPGTERILAAMRALSPAYTAEIIQLRPYAGNETLLQTLRASLLDIVSYDSIPYFSDRGGKWYMLYDSAVITAQEAVSDSVTKLGVDFEMSPFGTVSTDITLEEHGESLYYTLTNTRRMRYRDLFNVIRPQKMQNAITVFRSGDCWVLYAISGVDTYKFFFLKERVERAFINRIRAFCDYIFAKV